MTNFTTGVVKSLSEAKGFVCITPLAVSDLCFYHSETLAEGDSDTLNEGASVEFEF